MSLGGGGSVDRRARSDSLCREQGSLVAISGGNSFDEGNPISIRPASLGKSMVPCVGGGDRPIATTERTTSRHWELHRDCARVGISETRSAGVIYQTGLLDDRQRPALVRGTRFDRCSDQPLQGTSMAAPHVPAWRHSVCAGHHKSRGDRGRHQAIGHRSRGGAGT